MANNFDFSGWATKANILCADGRTILKDAFADNDGQKVPLVWNHQHNDTKNVLGHALLENRDDGVYAYCSFNNTDSGKRAKEFVQNGDVCALSIYANQLKQHGSAVVHGIIREVSLVLAGANPGACIDNVIMHGEEFEDCAIIYSGEDYDFAFEHSADNSKSDKKSDSEEETEDPEMDKETKNSTSESEEGSEKDDEETKKESNSKELEHSKESAEEDSKEQKKENKKMADKEKTVQDVLDELTEEQKKVVYALIGAALDENKNSSDDEEEGDKKMKHNVFENDTMEDTLSHDAMNAILADGKKYGTLKESFLEHSVEYGIENIDWLHPDYRNITEQPGFITRTPDEWVKIVMDGVKHTPFAKIKMMFADLREDEARAKGYIKGKFKKEEVFSLLKRTVAPTTIYKKQKIDRDDILDITDFDVVAWLKTEMRTMLDEEIARAIIFGDGRTALSEDKINEANVIPVVKDADLYSIKHVVTPASGETLAHAIIKGAVKGQETYEGSGNTILFTSVSYVTDMLLEEDKDGHRLYRSMDELALAMSVNKIVKVPASIIPEGVYGVIVDLKDYNLGADKGGSVNMFDDFDIDYNAQKYLIETRCSGALIKPFSAVVLKSAEALG